MKRKILTGSVSAVFMLFLVSIRPVNAYMQINNGDACTTSQTVTLSIPAFNVNTFEVQYHASENPNTLSQLQWLSLGTNSVQFHLSSGYGIKKVYFQTRTRVRPGVGAPTASHAWKYTQILSDSINYLRSCNDPKFSRQISLTISRKYEPFRFDVVYNLEVGKVSDPNNSQIKLAVNARRTKNWIALGTPVTIPYGGQLSSSATYRHTGTLTIAVPANTSSQPSYKDLKITATIEPKPGVSGWVDIDTNNNTSSREIQLVTRTQSRTHPVTSCTGAEGDKNNILVPVGNAWVFGGSKLTLNDCGSTTGNEIKCDNNPVPGIGLRGVRWTRRPSTGSNYGLHWYCEGFANKRDNSSWGYYFRYRVEYDIVEIRIVQ
jgi:hypothetical protein